MQTLDLALLKNFVIVAQTGSISLASQQVGRTQSALSMQMQRLEEQLGKRLFHRTGAGVRLTTVGERLVVHAEALLAQHDEMVMDMSGSALRGTVSLGCTEDYASAFLPQLLGSFCATYPDIDLRLVCAPSNDLRPQLQQRMLDMALVSLPSPEAEGVIRREQLVWVANDADPAILSAPILPLALSSPATLDYRAASSAMEAISRRYRVAYASNSLAGLLAIARSGHAISVLTRSAVPQDLCIIGDALPPLPAIGITLEVAEQRASLAVTTLSDHICSILPHL
ncbi:LysR family transcriptional regulator [uncultured Cohaesibacter sp.]|uniref:LysR family transcriptional regulator n=1 Tax=uncultured Cohaesibacter sp. TaxID=1002546 RepID=UPI00293158C4|nr:LysR family transcriptional regulator [uncultured Cohaesibacter sp.]